MNAKVNVFIELSDLTNQLVLELWDVDTFKDDLLASQQIPRSGHFEFLFDSNDSGEFRPELQLRVYDICRNELYKTQLIIPCLVWLLIKKLVGLSKLQLILV